MFWTVSSVLRPSQTWGRNSSLVQALVDSTTLVAIYWFCSPPRIETVSCPLADGAPVETSFTNDGTKELALGMQGLDPIERGLPLRPASGANEVAMICHLRLSVAVDEARQFSLGT